MTLVMWRDWDARESWDQQIILELTAGAEYEHREMRWSTPRGYRRGAVCVIPGQHYVKAADQFADEIASLPWALTVVCSDEEALFPVELLPRDATHQVWTQYHSRGMDKIIPIGTPPGTGGTIAALSRHPERDLDVFFAGQDTHSRRHELLSVLPIGATEVLRTEGFRQGMEQHQFLDRLLRTRIAPCPSGPHSLDSFRLYEALAAGALPVIETHTPHGDEEDFWLTMFGPDHCPLPVVSRWTALPEIVESYANPDVWAMKRATVLDWWADWRAQLQADFNTTVQTLKAAAE